MYKPEKMTQSEIAKKNCVERSMVSGMLTEASNQGIIEFSLNNFTQTANAFGANHNIQETLNLTRQSDVILTRICECCAKIF